MSHLRSLKAFAFLFFLSFPGMLLANGKVLNWNCSEFGSGCTNSIPESGTSGDMLPSLITVQSAADQCLPGSNLDAESVAIRFKATHTFRADLDVSVTHVPTAITALLFADVGGSGDDFDVTIDDVNGTNSIGDGNCTSGSTCVGTYKSQSGTALEVFNDMDATGDWRLDVVDDAGGDVGQLVEWGVNVFLKDSDGDGIANCYDLCPEISNYLDSDGDGTPDCSDECSSDAAKISAGACGCGESDVDSDGDTIPNCFDGCSMDSAKVFPGICGCGVSDADANLNGIADCMTQEEFKDLVSRALTKVKMLRSGGGNKALSNEVNALATELEEFVAVSLASIVTIDASFDVQDMSTKTAKKMRKSTKTTSSKFKKLKRRAKRALLDLSNGLA